MYYLKLSIVLVLCVILSASPALAAAITNLTDKPQTISFSEWNGEREVIIPVGQTLRITGMTTIRYNDREMRIDEDVEYAIWEDGQFGPQRRIKRYSPF